MSLNWLSARQQSRLTSGQSEHERFDHEKIHLSTLLHQLNIQTDSIKYNYQNFKSLSMFSSNLNNTRVSLENNHLSTFDTPQLVNSKICSISNLQFNKKTKSSCPSFEHNYLQIERLENSSLSKYERNANNNNHNKRQTKKKNVPQNETSDFHHHNEITVRQISCKRKKKKKIFINRNKRISRSKRSISSTYANPQTKILTSPVSNNLLSQTDIVLSRDSITSSAGSTQVLPVVYNETKSESASKPTGFSTQSTTIKVQRSKYENIQHLVTELRTCITMLGDLLQKERQQKETRQSKSIKKKNHLLESQDQLKRCLLIYHRKRNSNTNHK